jgi:multiple sugar transport system substrate-binding protein
MSGRKTARVLLLVLMVLVTLALLRIPPFDRESSSSSATTAGRETVVFWHFWGGADRDVVEHVVTRFNESQNKYFVRAVAMPGNNLDLKVFLSVAGGDPPDVINQDDPIIGEWASRGALLPLDQVASQDEMRQLSTWLLPAARDLCTYQNQMYGLCNGLDVRGLYFNRTWLKQSGSTPPETIAQLDQLAVRLT